MLDHFNEVVDIVFFVKHIASEVQQVGHFQEILSLGNTEPNSPKLKAEYT